jgi:hypothetical protein
VLAFLRDVLGANLVLPEVITSKAIDPSAMLPLIQLAVPTQLGRLEFTFGEGRFGNNKAVMLDTSVSIQRSLGSEVETVMDALTAGRQLIHDTFRGLTARLHKAMEPV